MIIAFAQTNSGVIRLGCLPRARQEICELLGSAPLERRKEETPYLGKMEILRAVAVKPKRHVGAHCMVTNGGGRSTLMR